MAGIKRPSTKISPDKEIDNLKAENTALRQVISDADQDIRIELSYAGPFPGGPKELKYSLESLIEEYRKLANK